MLKFMFRAATRLVKTDIYSVTNIFVQKTVFFYKLFGIFLVQNLDFFQGNTRGDQWNTVKPLEVPLKTFLMCFKHGKDQNIAKGRTDPRQLH